MVVWDPGKTGVASGLEIAFCVYALHTRILHPAVRRTEPCEMPAANTVNAGCKLFEASGILKIQLGIPSFVIACVKICDGNVSYPPHCNIVKLYVTYIATLLHSHFGLSFPRRGEGTHDKIYD